MTRLLKIHLWKYGFQIFFLFIFGVAGMYEIDKHGDYFQITVSLWKFTITLQLGTIEHEQNKRR